MFPTGSTNSSEGLWKTYITHSENEEPDEMVNIKKKFLCNSVSECLDWFA